MDDSRRETTGDRSTQIAMTMGLLLFASVILGSGALGDDRGLNASDGATDENRDDANDRVDLEMDRDNRDWEENRIDPGVQREMAYMWCHDHVFGTFWENTGDVLELEDGSGFEITIYDDAGNEEGWFLPPDAMWQITSGLATLVHSCAEMKMEKMDHGMDRDDRRGHDRHRIDCDRIDWDEDEPRDSLNTDEDDERESDEVDREDEDEDEDEAGARPADAAGDEEEDEPDPDEVEADLDAILKDRIAASDDDEEEEEEGAPPKAPSPAGLVERQETEIHCPHCFLLVQAKTVAEMGECGHCGGPIS